MGNPADNVVPVTKEIRTDNKEDIARINEVMEFLQNSQIFWGVIRFVDTAEKGKFKIDIFSSPGYGTISYNDIEAHQLDLSDNYVKGNRVRCYYIDGIAYIKGLALPRGAGKYLVLMLIDDENPGTAAYDRPRLT